MPEHCKWVRQLINFQKCTKLWYEIRTKTFIEYYYYTLIHWSTVETRYFGIWLSRDLYRWNVNTLRAGSCAFDFTQLPHWKCFGTKWKTEISNFLSVFYLVPKHFPYPNWVKSIAHDLAPIVVVVNCCNG